MRNLRDNGWIETIIVLKKGLNHGLCLEVGPGYLGLEWLSKTEGTNLRALEISPDMASELFFLLTPLSFSSTN